MIVACDKDEPDDTSTGQPTCKDDGDCVDGQQCVDGACVAAPECSTSDDCEAGESCAEGQCVTPPCSDDADCSDGDVCESTACVPGCAEDSDCGGGEVCNAGHCGPDPAFWVVGDQGAVLRVNASGDVDVHPPAAAVELLAIACHGDAMAWYVGVGGAAGRTVNGGATWTPLALDVAATLHDVTASPPMRVAVVGEGGTLLESENGETFVAIAGAAGTLRGVDLSPERAIAVAEDGAIWRHDRGAPTATLVTATGAALISVDLSDHGLHGAAVGLDGALLWTEDGGETWTPRSSGTNVDLHAVQVASGRRSAVAVGDDGVVVRIDGDAVEVAHVTAADLRAIHLNDQGAGAAVGALGAVLITSDEAASFVPIAAPVSVTLRGVDALGDHHW